MDINTSFSNPHKVKSVPTVSKVYIHPNWYLVKFPCTSTTLFVAFNKLLMQFHVRLPFLAQLVELFQIGWFWNNSVMNTDKFK